eukprot:CAMPEP_0115085560 /NCGR_PEP_ID=MMETSP0227-20121206/22013_1 /TAXON_ID=89957 /ORGANISM="Polarella glacialis, Strain CCMP 1383" /LENGTH=125 /DNA_ID=CAMNT_0002474751 /DNA_START=523 /DNA_END=901 /DNA_ORIENTATION=-
MKSAPSLKKGIESSCVWTRRPADGAISLLAQCGPNALIVTLEARFVAAGVVEVPAVEHQEFFEGDLPAAILVAVLPELLEPRRWDFHICSDLGALSNQGLKLVFFDCTASVDVKLVEVLPVPLDV